MLKKFPGIFFIAALAWVLLPAAGPALAQGAAGQGNSAYEPTAPGAAGAAGRETPIVRAIRKAGPAVVSVYAQVMTRSQGSPFGPGDPFNDEFFNQFFNDFWGQRSRPGLAIGSGAIIDGDRGVIVTNEHVIRGAGVITVTLSDGQELAAEVLGADPEHDLAVLRVKAGKTLPSLPLADSDNLMIGETVIAIGNPFGLSQTVTTGVVSALGRAVPGDRRGGTLKNLIQTDASINPGNSGGPLINVAGELVGINTAIMPRGEGLGFAIPSAQVRRISQALLREDKGVLALDLGLELAEPGRPRKGETGCLVTMVVEGSPAAKAGFKKGDFLVSLDGSATNAVSDYEMILQSLPPGRSVPARVMRDGRLFSADLSPEPMTERQVLDELGRRYGLGFTEKRGWVELKEPRAGTAAKRMGLAEGDVLVSLGNGPVKTLADLAKAAAKQRFNNQLSLVVQRGPAAYRLTLPR